MGSLMAGWDSPVIDSNKGRGFSFCSCIALGRVHSGNASVRYPRTPDCNATLRKNLMGLCVQHGVVVDYGALVAGLGTGGLERNKSLTKEEIENYWRLKRRVEEEHLKALAESLGAAGDEGDQTPQQRPVSGRPTRLETSNSFPAAGSRFLKDEESERNTRAWWTRSNWAFLNEPPLREMEGPAYKYAAQYHIADPSDRVSNILGDPKTAMPPDGVASMS